jgi:carboxylate-amine ligase
MEFPGSAPTVGIEWEVALVDPVTRDLVAKAPEIMAELDRRYPGHTITREFLANTLEMVTGVHETIPDAVEDLRGQLAKIMTVAGEMGVNVFSAGTHPFAHWGDQVLSEKQSYNEIIERTQYWGRQMLIWGIHVHVGVGGRDRRPPRPGRAWTPATPRTAPCCTSSCRRRACPTSSPTGTSGRRSTSTRTGPG